MEAQIPKYMQQLLTEEGYFNKFVELSNQFNTYEEAFETLERVYYSIFNINRYKNYDSFRVAKSKFFKKNHKS